MNDQKPEDDFSDFDDDNFDDADFGVDDFENESFESGDIGAAESGDEFYDEEDPFGDETWDDDGFEAEEPQADKKPKKAKKSGKGFSSNMIIILVGAVVGIGIMGMQLFKKPENVVPEDAPFISALTPTGQHKNPLVAAQNENQDTSGHVQEGGFLQNPSQISQAPGSAAPLEEPPMPAYIATGQMDNAETVPAPAETVVQSELTPMPVDSLSDTPELPVMQADAANMAEDVNQDSADMPQPRGPDDSPEELAAPSMETASLKAPQESLEENKAAELLNQVMKASQKELQPDENIAQVEMQVADTPIDAFGNDGFGEETQKPMQPVEEQAQPQEPSQKIVQELGQEQNQASMALQEELDRMRTLLEEERQNNARERDSLAQQLAVLREELQDTKEALEKAESSPALTAPAPKAASTRKAAPKAAAPKKSTLHQTASRPKSWELRAAQPGKAWVSEVGGRGEMRAVVVGDTLDGVGTISSITYAGGIWTVQGSSGRITQ